MESSEEEEEVASSGDLMKKLTTYARSLGWDIVECDYEDKVSGMSMYTIWAKKKENNG